MNFHWGGRKKKSTTNHPWKINLLLATDCVKTLSVKCRLQTRVYRVLSLNVIDPSVLEAPCWQPVKVGTAYGKAAHQLEDANHPAELVTELTA